jgi:hypothetical protein
MRIEKTSGLGLFQKLKEHVVFMKEAAKNCAFLGSFFDYFLWGGMERGGGGVAGDGSFTSELVL